MWVKPLACCEVANVCRRKDGFHKKTFLGRKSNIIAYFNSHLWINQDILQYISAYLIKIYNPMLHSRIKLHDATGKNVYKDI